MYNVTETFLNKITENSRAISGKLYLGDLELTDVDLISMDMEYSLGNDSIPAIGGVVSSRLNVKLFRDKLPPVLTTQELKPYLGLEISKGNIEYIPMGVYRINPRDTVKTDKTVSLVGYDILFLLEDSPYESNLTFPATWSQIKAELISKGLKFANQSLTNVTIKEKPNTIRELLSDVAELLGMNVVSNRLGEIEFRGLSSTTFEFDNHKSFKLLADDEVKLTRLTVEKEEEEITYGNDTGFTIKIKNDSITTENELMTVYNRVFPLSYIAYECEVKGYPHLDVGDIIKIVDRFGVERYVPIAYHKISYRGGLKSEIRANAPSGAISSTGSTGSRSITQSLNDLRINILEVNHILADKADINLVVANEARINDLYAVKATVSDLQATNARVGTLEVGYADVNVLKANVADINTLLAGNLDATNMKAGLITATSGLIANLAITNAMIANMDVSKLNAGDISTSKFRVKSDSGNLRIQDNTIQIADSVRTRVQIGKDANNDYNMYVWDANGKLMFDAAGLRADGIKSPIIRDDMVSPTANISGDKLNISSVVTAINNGVTRIESSHINYDGKSLNVAFGELETNLTNTVNKTVKSTDVEYYLSTSPTSLSGGTWQTTAPTWVDGKYMWSRTKVTLSDGSVKYTPSATGTCIAGAKGDKGDQGIQGPKGVDGTTYYTWIKYADTPTSGMSDSPTNKKYMGIAYNKISPTKSSNYGDYTWSLIQGPQGNQGIQGPAGNDGQPTYTWIKYAATPTSGMVDIPTASTPYIGIAYNKTTPTESTNYSDYTWSLIKGAKGDKGDDGKGVASTAIAYQLHTSGTSAPTGTWSSNIPSPIKGRYLWTRTITTYTDNSTVTTYSVSYIPTDGQNGSDGKGILSTVVTYQLHTNGTTAPTGTWSSDIPAIIKGRYLWTRTIITYTDNSTSTSYSTSYYPTDGQKGDTGRGITSITPEYYLSTSKTTQTGGSWVTAPPAYISGRYMWIRNKIVYNNPTSTEYTTPVVDNSWETMQADINTRVKTTDFTIEQGKINTLISDVSTVQGEVNSTKSRVSTVEQTVNGITTKVANLETDNNTTKSNLSALTQDVNSFKTTVSSTYSTKTEVDNKIDVAKSTNFGYRYKVDIVIYGESNLYYPVVIKGGNQNVKRDIFINRGYSEQAPPDWYTATHKGGLIVKIKTNFGGWDGAKYSWEIHELEEMYSRTFAGATICGNYTMFAIFLRGGGETGAKYHIYSDQPLDSNLYSPSPIPPSPQIAYNKDLIFQSGSYLAYAPEPRAITAAVEKEIADRRFIKLAQDTAAEIPIVYDTIETKESQIKQYADQVGISVQNTVANTYETKTGVDQKINTAKGEIKVTTDAIESRVSNVETTINTVTPHHIILTNENQSIAVNSSGTIVLGTSLSTDIDTFKGTNRIAATIGTPLFKTDQGRTISTGITITKSNPTTNSSGKVTCTFTLNANFMESGGWIEIPLTIEGKSYIKKLYWSKVKDGAKGDTGSPGTNAKLVDIVPSQIYFVKKQTGITPDTITLTPNFQNCTYSKWEYSINGTSWTAITQTTSSSTVPWMSSSTRVLTVPKAWTILVSNSYVVFRVTSSTGESDVQTISILYDVTELETRVNNAEQKITPTAIMQTVEQQVSQGGTTIAQKSDITQTMDEWVAKFDYLKSPIPFRYVRSWLLPVLVEGIFYVISWAELEVYRNGTNIARGKTVTTNEPKLVERYKYTDGDIGSTVTIIDATQGKWTYLQVDLGQIYSDINSIIDYIGFNEGTKYQYKLEVSEDGVNWYTLYSGTKTNSANNYGLSGFSQGIVKMNGQDGIIVKHSDDWSQYSQVKFDGFIRKWEYGEAKYLNDIHIAQYTRTSLRTTNIEDVIAYEAMRLTLPQRFRARPKESIAIFLAPVSLDFWGSSFTSSGTVTYYNAYSVIKLEVVDYVLDTASPYVDVKAIQYASIRKPGEPSEFDISEMKFLLIVIGQ